jgi:hypothetical protein
MTAAPARGEPKRCRRDTAAVEWGRRADRLVPSGRALLVCPLELLPLVVERLTLGLPQTLPRRHVLHAVPGTLTVLLLGRERADPLPRALALDVLGVMFATR